MIKRYYKSIAGVMAIVLSAGVFLAPAKAKEQNEGESVSTEAGAKGETESKEEVVYAALQADGSIKNVYTVNVLNVTEPGLVTDYADFDQIVNLTTSEVIQSNDDVITINAGKGRFYYQGTQKDSELPWNIDISYSLDNNKINSTELAGKNGKLEIRIRTEQNKNMDDSFYESFMLQISLSLNSANCKNIVAEEANIANAGSAKMVTFTVMPKKDGDMVLKADVEDFEMDGISISAVPFSMDMDFGDTAKMTGEFETLADAIADLNEGASELKEGTGDLNSGAYALNSNSGNLANGVSQLNNGAVALTEGITGLKDGIFQVNDGAGKLKKGSKEYLTGISSLSKGSGNLTKGSGDIKKALDEMNTGFSTMENPDLSAITNLSSGLESLYSGIDTILTGLGETEMLFQSISGLAGSVSNISSESIDYDSLGSLDSLDASQQEQIRKLCNNYTNAQNIKSTFEGLGLDGLSATVSSLKGSLETIKNSVSEMKTGLAGVDLSSATAGISQFQSGIAALAESYGKFHEGLVTYTGGVDQLADNYVSINSGIVQLSKGISGVYSGTEQLAKGSSELSNGLGSMAEGTGQLVSGISQLADGTSKLDSGVGDFADGIKEFHTETKGLPDKVQEQIDEMLEDFDTSDIEIVSFTSPKNKDIASVQFVLSAEGIKKEEMKEEIMEEKEEENFFTRLRDLF